MLCYIFVLATLAASSQALLEGLGGNEGGNSGNDTDAVSCEAFQSTSLSIGLPLIPINAKLACELHCTGRGGVLNLCLGILGNCACAEALSNDDGKVSCKALQQTVLSIGGPIPISLASACELHCTAYGGVLNACGAVALGNCVCVGVGLPGLLGMKAPRAPALPGK